MRTVAGTAAPTGEFDATAPAQRLPTQSVERAVDKLWGNPATQRQPWPAED